MTNCIQQPVDSGFTATSTTKDVISGLNLSGKNAVVTGGYSGLGRETVRVLNNAGANVIVPARSVEKAVVALEGIRGVNIMQMDLLDPNSIGEFTSRFLEKFEQLHILVNSAGIMAVPELTVDNRGYEIQFATNHLGHFQLTKQLLPALHAAHKSRVVTVSSLGHRYSPVVFDDINFEKRAYDPWKAYGQSKTANILFSVELDRLERANGVRSFSLHPGSIAGTGLEKHIPKQMLIDAGVIEKDGTPIIDPSRNLKTVEQGASTIVWCATSPSLNGMGGLYCENCEVAPISTFGSQKTTMDDATRINGVMPYAVDSFSAQKLWTLSEQMLSK